MNVVVLFRHDILVNGVLKSLNQLGARTHVVTNVRAPAVRLSRLCHRYELIKLPGEPVHSFEFINWMNRYARKHQIDVVIPADVETARLLSVNQFGLLACACYPISRKDVLTTLDNKGHFAAFLERHRIATPRTAVVERLADLDNGVLDGLKFPVMVKPPLASGGTGVVRKDSPEDLRAYLESGVPLSELPVVVQQFVPGETVGINLIALNGEIVTSTVQREPDKKTLIFTSDERIEDLGRQVASALNYTGIANIDFRVREGDGEPFVMECNPRFGFRTWVSMLFGVNFVDIGIRMAMGMPLPSHFPRRHGQYVHHRDTLKALLWRRPNAQPVSAESRQALRLALSDPLPIIYGLVRRVLLRLGARLGIVDSEV